MFGVFMKVLGAPARAGGVQSLTTLWFEKDGPSESHIANTARPWGISAKILFVDFQAFRKKQKVSSWYTYTHTQIYIYIYTVYIHTHTPNFDLLTQRVCIFLTKYLKTCILERHPKGLCQTRRDPRHNNSNEANQGRWMWRVVLH